MDVLYEESAVNAHAEKAQKRYKILNIFSKLFGVIALVIAVIFFFNLITFLFALSSMDAEGRGSAIGMLLFLFMIELYGFFLP